MIATTEGTLLGGAVRYTQPEAGYRTGIEPVLLAACVPARPGQSVLEGGTGAGAGLLCLVSRVAGLRAAGIERDAAMAALARRNAAANHRDLVIHTADISVAPGLGPVDHAFANPPWHDPGSTRSLDSRRDAATHREESGLETWIACLSAAVTRSGTVSLALPAALAGSAMAALHGAGMGRIALLPLWPREGVAAKIVLLQARRGAGPSRVLPGLVLHESGSGYSAAAETVLRGGAALPLDQSTCG